VSEQVDGRKGTIYPGRGQLAGEKSRKKRGRKARSSLGRWKKWTCKREKGGEKNWI